MLKKDIEYVNFDEEKRTKTCYFHLSKVELIEINIGGKEGSLQAHMERIIAAKDTSTVLKEIKRIILMSYGERSDDGENFTKSDEIRTKFEQSPVFDALFMELLENPSAAGDFVVGVVPKDMSSNVKQAIQDQPLPVPAAYDASKKTPTTNEPKAPPSKDAS